MMSLEQRQTTSEHRMSGAYRRVSNTIMDYETLADYMQECVDLVESDYGMLWGLKWNMKKLESEMKMVN